MKKGKWKKKNLCALVTWWQSFLFPQKWNNHSVYTYYLLKGLQGAADYNQNRVISLTELYLYLKTYVRKDANPTPQRITLDSSRGGQFVFYREGED